MKFSYEMFLYNSFDIKHEIFSCGVLMKIIIFMELLCNLIEVMAKLL